MFMHPPKEWLDADPQRAGYVWHNLQTLYGRQNASNSFWEFLEAIACSVPDTSGELWKGGFKQGTGDACLYYSKALDTALIHHVHDGRCAGPDESISHTMTHFAK